jgi:excisionase family DNA binding protein
VRWSTAPSLPVAQSPANPEGKTREHPPLQWVFFKKKIAVEFKVVLHPSVLAHMKAYRATPSASTSSLPKLLTTTEVMPLLRVTTRGTLCAWVRAGKLPAIRMPDNSYCFDEAVIMAWLDNRKVTSGGA